MTDHTADMSPRKAAIVSGVGLTIMFVAAVVATDVTISGLIVKGDAAATTTNIEASEMVFRIGIFGWMVDMIANVVVAWGLYVLLKPVNRDLSLLMAWFRLAYVAIFAAALVNLVEVLPLVSGTDHLTALGAEQLQAQVMHSVSTFDSMWSIGLVVFAFHVLVLGFLLLKSGYAPKAFGILLIVAFCGYLIINLGKLLVPGYEAYETVVGVPFLLAMVIGEVGLGFWLLIRGGRVRPQVD